MTPAEQRAQRENLPVVRLVPHDCMRIATGNPIICSTVDGKEVLVRLYTTDEFYDAHVEAATKYGARVLSRAEIHDRCRPIHLDGAW